MKRDYIDGIIFKDKPIVAYDTISNINVLLTISNEIIILTNDIYII